jgi:hypothetical protein
MEIRTEPADAALMASALGSRSCAGTKSDPSVPVMKRFRTHTVIFILIAVGVVIILLSRSIRVRLEWGTGGFVLGLVAAAIVALDIRHHRKGHET